MNNFADGNPNTYVYLTKTSEVRCEIAIIRLDEQLQINVFPDDAVADELYALDAHNAAELLNARLEGGTALVHGHEHIDLVDEIFSLAGTQARFSLKNIAEGWDEAMEDSFQEIKASQKAETAMELACAVRKAHESMIPF